jgi:thioredoxin
MMATTLSQTPMSSKHNSKVLFCTPTPKHCHQSLRRLVRPCASSKNTKHSTNTFKSFDDMISSVETPLVLVDFYATWCGPCHLMATVMSECSKDMKKDVSFMKVDTEKYPQIASRFQVSALPTLVLFKNGVAVSRIEGALSAKQLKDWLRQFVATI